MELRQIEYFLAVARTNNMTEAARELHISQPSLSSAIKNLEKEMGVSLFDRYGKRVEINDVGRHFAERAQASLTILEEGARNASDKQHERENTVNCSIGIPVGNAGALLRSFLQAHPGIRLKMGYPSSLLFKDQTVDVHLFGTSMDLDDSNVIKLGYERYVLALPPNHPLAGRSEASLRELRYEPFIMTEPSEIRSESLSMCRAAGFEPRVAYETQVCFEALNMVQAGFGCAIAAEFTWLNEATQDLAVVPLSDSRRGRYLYARLPEGVAPSPATWSFIEFLQDYSDNLRPTKWD